MFGLCYICSFKNFPITILEVVDSEDCVRENKLPLLGPGCEAPSRWAILTIFFFRKKQKTDILTPFG